MMTTKNIICLYNSKQYFIHLLGHLKVTALSCMALPELCLSEQVILSAVCLWT